MGGAARERHRETLETDRHRETLERQTGEQQTKDPITPFGAMWGDIGARAMSQLSYRVQEFGFAATKK
jgi:hypothetical protein